MRIVKIFIASSDELKPERRILADMQGMLNNRLFKQGIILQLEFWEHLDSSMGIKDKQEEYNDVLRECDGCIAMFWTKFGDYTKEEFELAYSGMSKGANPKHLSALFKNTEEETSKLQTFKDEFEKNYGNIASTFSTNDELRIALIKQVEAILANSLEDSLYTIGNNNEVVVDGNEMGKIKVLNVYIAMADDVDVEEHEFMDLISRVNKIFIRRNMCLNIIKHKQNMGDLRECELCMTLYCTKFGNYTKDDLKGAYKELQEGNNPRKLYVFFKNSEDVTPELKAFKKDFVKDFAHFFCKFENVDTMRLEFLLQLEAYQNHTSERFLKVENQKIKIGSEVEGYEDVVDLNNVPFAALNKKYVDLRDGIEKLSRQIQRCRKRLDKDTEDTDSEEELVEHLSDMQKMQEEFDNIQNVILNTAVRVAKIKSEEFDDQLLRAIEAFEEGNLDGAHALLKEVKIKVVREREAYKLKKESIEVDRNNLIIRINQLTFYAEAVLGSSKYSAEERIKEANEAYNQAVLTAIEIEYDKEKLISLILDTAYFSQRNNLFEQAIQFYEKALLIRESSVENAKKGISNIATSLNDLSILCQFGKSENSHICSLNIREYLTVQEESETATILYNLSILYKANKLYDKAEKSYIRALELYESLAKIIPPYLSDVADVLNDIANLYKTTKRYEQADEYYVKALEISESLASKELDAYLLVVAKTLLNSIDLYKITNNYEQIEQNLNRALEIYECFAKSEPYVYHPYVAKALNCLADLYSGTNRYEQAENNYIRALNLYMHIIGEQESNTYLPHIAEVLNNLANLYSNSYRYEQAEENYSKMLEIYESLEKKEPKIHLSNYAATHNNLATIYADTKRYDLAENSYIRALEIYKSLDKNEANIYLLPMASIHNNLANIYTNTNRYDLAESDYKRAYRIYGSLAQRESKVYNSYVAMIHYNLAHLYRITFRYEQAESSYLRALRIFHILNEEENNTHLPSIATAHNGLAILYFETNCEEQSKKNFIRALEIRELLAKKEPNVHLPSVAETFICLGMLFETKVNDLHQAEEYYTSASNIYIELCKKDLKQFIKHYINTLGCLHNVYNTTKQIEKTEELHKMLTEIHEIFEA